jgi:putative component of membrane protein insertase Oxa1/YidC/SpoIIIJ protein YidD
MRPHRQPRRLTAALLRRIDHHRGTSLSGRGTCRFTPSCSYFAEELLQTRPLPVALPLIGWRLLRCNPMLNRHVADPVQRPRRRLRPNTLPTFFSVLALSGLVVVLTAATAQAVGVSGGCTATINGKQPSSLTKDDPLEVHKGETVSVTGTAPAGTPKTDANNTHIDVAVIDGVFAVSSSDHPGHGPNWGGTQNVDDYLKYGVGLYHVTGVAEGSSGWHCEGDGYVELKDGSPLTKPIGAGAAAMMVVGGLGAVLASRGKRSEADSSASFMDRDGGSMDEMAVDEAETAVNRAGDAMAGFGCLILVIIACFVAIAESTLFAAVAPAAPGAAGGKRRFWAHGHPIAGFISGLVSGIGIAVLLQQFAVWPLTIVTAIIFPLVVAVLCALRAYLGRPYEIRPRRETAAV